MPAAAVESSAAMSTTVTTTAVTSATMTTTTAVAATAATVRKGKAGNAEHGDGQRHGYKSESFEGGHKARPFCEAEGRNQ